MFYSKKELKRVFKACFVGCGKLDFKNGFLDILRNPTEASAPKFEAEPGWPCCTCCQILIHILQRKPHYHFQSFSLKI
jgi:hypothetical protein